MTDSEQGGTVHGVGASSSTRPARETVAAPVSADQVRPLAEVHYDQLIITGQMPIEMMDSRQPAPDEEADDEDSPA